MTADELDAIVKELRESAAWQLEGQRDQPLSLEAIQTIEAQERVTFPDAFKDFLHRYGAGDFAFSQVYSPDRKSVWNLWDHFLFMPQRKSDLIPFSDNGCGDYYCFPLVNGICEDRVVWADHEQDYCITESEYVNFRDFIARACLRHGE